VRVLGFVMVGFLALVALLLGGGALFWWLGGNSAERWVARTAIETALHRDVEIDGAVEVTLGSQPTLSLSQIQVDSPSWATEPALLRVAKAEVQIALRPLLDGVLLLPRVALDGVTVELETDADGRHNWQSEAASSSAPTSSASTGEGHVTLPLIADLSLTNATVTYRNQRDGARTDLQITSLTGHRDAASGSMKIDSDGAVNGNAFRVRGEGGSLEQALADAPYPIEVEFELPALTAKLTGTITDVTGAQTLDLQLSAESASVLAAAKAWSVEWPLDPPVDAKATATTRLTGDIAAVALSDLVAELDGPSGDRLRLTGSLADAWQGTGLDAGLEVSLASSSALIQWLPEEWRIVDKLTASAHASGSFAAPAVTDLVAEIDGSGGDRLHLTGGIADARQGTGLDAKLDLSLATNGALAQWLPEEWRIVDGLTASTHASGSFAALALDDLSLAATGAGGSSLETGGKALLAIADEVAIESFDLTAKATIADPAAFDQLLGVPLSALGPLSSSATLALANGTLTVAPLEIDAEQFGMLQVGAQGSVGTLGADADLELQPDLTVSIKMADGKPLAALVDDRLAGLGAIDLSARLVGGEQGYRLEAIELALGAAENLSLAADGTIGPLTLDDPDATPIDLTVRFDAPAISALDSLAGEKLPDLGKVEGELELTGTLGTFQIDNARLQTERKDGVTVSASGGGATIVTEPFRIEGATVDVDARAPSTTAVAKLLGYDAPDLGAVRARTKLVLDDRVIALSGLDATTGKADAPSARLTGAIGDLLAFQKVDLNGTLAIPTSTLLAWIDLHGKTEVGRLHGKIRLSDARGKVGMEYLEAELKETNLIALTMEGAIEDLAALDKVQFETSIQVPNVANLADVFDADAGGLEAFRFDGKLSGNDQRFDANGKATLGQTDVDGTIAGDFTGARPSFKGKLTSPQLRLADLGLRPEGNGTTNTSQARAKNQPLFSNESIPLEGLRDFDLDLDVQVDKIDGVKIAISDANAHVALTDGALDVSPMRFVFVGGHAEFNAKVDARDATPAWSVRAEADNVNLANLWSQLRTEVPVAGNLDLVADLQARGRSPQDLASSLDGNASIAVQHGQLQTSLLGLTTMSPLHWLVSEQTRRGYADIDCFVARFKANQGVAQVGTLVLDTPDVIVKGKGTIDLGRETLNLKFNPKPKQKRIASLTTAFALKGNLADPSVDVSAAGTVARAIGEVVLSPINLLGSLLPFVDDGKKRDNPCLKL